MLLPSERLQPPFPCSLQFFYPVLVLVVMDPCSPGTTGCPASHLSVALWIAPALRQGIHKHEKFAYTIMSMSLKLLEEAGEVNRTRTNILLHGRVFLLHT
jgi:hypothetical protein